MKRWLALPLMSSLVFSLFAFVPSLAGNRAYAHGPGPGSCGNEYDYTLESMTVSNGVHTFDVLANQDNGFIFNGNNDEGHDVTFTIHTASQSRSGNTQNGSIWYHNNAFGFGQGVCVYDVQPDQEKTIVLEGVVPSQQRNHNADGELARTPWDFQYFKTIVEYYINWYDSSNFPDEDTGTATVRIEALDYNSSDFSNNRINGMYLNLTHNGQLVDEGFTPVTFTLENGKEYEIGAADYGDVHFYFWGQARDDPILPIKVAETSEVLLYAYYVTKDDSTDTASTTSELTVNAIDRSSGSQINGYWTVLTQDGNTVETGFTPASFTVDNGENYEVSTADYGQYVFDYWEETGSTARDRSISISSDTSITAVYRNVNESPTTTPPPDDEEEEQEDNDPATSQSAITVRTVNAATDSEIFGYYTILYDASRAVVDSGFSPATFDVTAGQEYTVEVQDYGSYYFNYWQDDGSTSRDKTFEAADSAQILMAVYSNSPSTAPPSEPPEDNGQEEEQPPQETTGEISVATVDTSGNQIYGYYTTLSLNGNVIQTGFSPVEFTVDGGKTYQVAVADYGSYTFDHWSDGSYDRFHDAEAGDGLTAVYRP